MRSALTLLGCSFLVLAVGGHALGDSRQTKVKRKRTVSPAAVQAAAPIPATVGVPERKQVETPTVPVAGKPEPVQPGPPIKLHVSRGSSKKFDVRRLPQIPPKKRDLPERELPPVVPTLVEPQGVAPTSLAFDATPRITAVAPAPIMNFDGLDKANWGAGMPPDTNGDVGPTHFIQSVNSSIGIYRKSDGVRLAAFTLDTLMSQGDFGNVCDSDNMGDPVVLYDTFEDRWIITDFAFTVDGSGNVLNPPGAYQCFAVSMSGDPVSGGWHFYSTDTTGGLGDYPKLGIWPDGLYMSVNMFDYAATGLYQGPRVYAFNKAQMYAGSSNVQAVVFNGPSADFTLLPSNARLQTGTPPAGTPNYFVATWLYLNAISVYKFHVDWSNPALSTFTGPNTPLASSSWPNEAVGNAATPGSSLDVLPIRAMMQNQYTNIGGVESLWTPHTVKRTSLGFAAPRWYQADVTGGTVATNLTQSATWDPDGSNVTYRYVPSLAVDRAGNLAMGYTTSNSATNPGIKYAGRLSTDSAGTFSQTEQTLIQGTGTQTGTCGGTTCRRWGDYATMTLDPDGCTFWLTSEYYAASGLDWLTRIGSFKYSECTQFGAGGTISGTVTAAAGGAAIAGATVRLGTRSTTTNGSGAYSFTSLPAGAYPTLTAEVAGFVTGSFTSVAVTDGGTTVRNFALAAGPLSGCFTDTSQGDFQNGVANNVDLTTSPGSVVLPAVATIDQQQTAVVSSTGYTLNSTIWVGQTFTPSITGQLVQVDLNLFCAGCSGTTPNIPVVIQGTSSGAPTTPDLATGTITGFSGSQRWVTVTFASPVTVNGGTLYAVVARPNTNPSAGTYAVSRGSGNVYPNGVGYQNLSATWHSQPNDLAFKVYINTGYASSGDLTSSVKDSNPASGRLPLWSTLTWSGTTPASTLLRFQVAGSSSSNGTFTFVGPDGTAGTYFTSSPASLAQFHGKRYLKHRAYLSTSNSAVTPTLNDAALCYSNQINAAPVLNAIGNKIVAESSLLAFTISASDADGDTITYSATGLPSGASLNASSGAFTWTPSVGQAGIYNVTFIASDGLGGTDSETIAITVTGVSPSNVVATAASAASVNISWAPSTSGVTYEVFRRAAGAGYISIGTTGSLGFTDNTVSGTVAYLYAVRSLDGGGSPSALSAPDLATTVIFTNDPLSAGTTVSAMHFVQLRSAINAVRALANLSPASFTNVSLTGVLVKKIHVDEMRSNLDAARSAMSLSALTYTDPTINQYSTIIKAAHVTGLRNGVK